MRRLRAIALGCLALLGVALLLAVGCGLALNQGWQRERLRAAVEAGLADALGDEVALGGIEGPLLPRLDLRELRVGPEAAPTLVVARLTAGLGWRRMLTSHQLVLRRLALRGARLTLERDPEGGWQLPPWLAGGGDGAAPPTLHVDRTELEDASLALRWSEQGDPAALLVQGSLVLQAWSLPARPDEPLRAHLVAQARGEGAATRWLERAQLEASLEGPRLVLESLSASGGRTPPLRLAAPAHLSWEDPRLVIEGLSLESDAQRLRLEGAVSRDGFDPLRAELRDLDVTLAGRLLGGTLRPGGRVSGELSLEGPFTRPRGRVDLTWSQPSLGPEADDLRADRLELRASGDGRAIRVETLELSGAPGGALRLARPATVRIGERDIELDDVDLRSDGQALLAHGGVSRDAFRDLEIELRGLDLARLGRTLGLAAQPGGTLEGELSLDGPFRHPAGRARLRWHEPRLEGFGARELALDARFDRETARLEGDLRRDADESLSLEASLPTRELALALEPASPLRTRGVLPDGLRARLRSDAFDLGGLDPLLPDPARRLRGTLSADLTLQGGAQPSLAGTLGLANASLALPGRPPLEGLRGDLALEPQPGRLGIERLRLEAPGLEIEARGSLAREDASSLEVDVSAPDLEALASRWNVGAPLTGAFEADVTLRGGWPRPSLSGNARWTHPAPDALTPHRVELDLRSSDRELLGSLSVHQAQRVAARGELTLPYGATGLPGLLEDAREQARLDLEAEDFDLATLSPLLPRLVRDLRGRADASLSLRPGPERPALAGVVHLRDGSIRVPTLRQSFAPIEGSLRLTSDAVRIEELRIGEEGRHADVSGELRLGPELRPSAFDMALDLQRLPLARSRPLTTDASGRLQLSGPPDALVLAGRIELSGARVRLVEPGDPALREFEVVTSDVQRRGRREMVERQRPPDAFERSRIDVALVVPRNSWVRGRGADIDLAGTLRLEKAPAGPARVSGSVSTLRGTYRFQGKRFDLRRGTVTFVGSPDLDPMLDIEAVHRVRDVTIVIQLSGFASEPVVSLSSEPPLREDDVLSYLFFGRPTSELGSTQPTGDLDRAAAAFAAGVALREASQLVEETLPIDTVDVRIEEDGSSGAVGVGKYLSDDLFVRYERGFGQDAVDGVKVELRLSDHWSIETEASTDESAGADLVWSYDY